MPFYFQIFVSFLFIYRQGLSIIHGGSLELDQSPCVRLFHRTGEFGCSTSSRDGLQLSLYGVIEDADSLDNFMKESSTFSQQVATVLSTSYFNETIVSQIIATSKVGAILVLAEDFPRIIENKSAHFSTDSPSPLGTQTPFLDLTLNPDYVWNPNGNSLAWHVFSNVPIVLIKQSSVEAVRSAVQQNAKRSQDSHPIYQASMEFYFGPSSVNSIDCLSWRDVDGTQDPQCLPLGGQSVWATQGVRDTRPVAMAVAGLDSTAMFHEQAYGANDAVASIITILAAADLLSRAEALSPGLLSSLEKQIAFGLFQGEEWGYIGSRRFAQDISLFNCNNVVDGDSLPSGMGMCLDPLYPSLAFQKLALEDISVMIAVDQVGLLQNNTDGKIQFYVMGGSSSDSPTLVSSIIDCGNQIGAPIAVDESQASQSSSGVLPPTPLTSFVKLKSALGTAVIAGYDGSFADTAYHTPYDEGARLSVDAISLAGELLGGSLFAAAGGSSWTTLGLNVNQTLVENLVQCFTKDASCSTVTSYIRDEVQLLYNENGLSVSYGTGDLSSYYSGVYGPSINSQPTFHRSTKDDDIFYGKFTGTWDGDSDEVYMIPGMLEAFVRSFLADKMAQGDYRKGSCSSSQDCGKCEDNYMNIMMECIQGTCVCKTAFFHQALDPGLQATETLGVFDIIDDSAPLIAEPNWSYIGVKIYLYSGMFMSYVSLVTGTLVAVASGAGVMQLKSALKKEKLL